MPEAVRPAIRNFPKVRAVLVDSRETLALFLSEIGIPPKVRIGNSQEFRYTDQFSRDWETLTKGGILACSQSVDSTLCIVLHSRIFRGMM